MTHAERLLWLAEQLVRCPSSAIHTESLSWSDLTDYTTRKSEIHCSTCAGTGKVPRFPTLRQKCPNWKLRHTSEGEAYGCGVCQGRGYVPMDDPKATLPCADEWRFEMAGEDVLAMCRLHPTSLAVLEHGATHNEAAISALYKCVMAEMKPYVDTAQDVRDDWDADFTAWKAVRDAKETKP